MLITSLDVFQPFEILIISLNCRASFLVLLESICNLKMFCSQLLWTSKSPIWSETHSLEALVSSECKNWNFILFCKKARFGSVHCYSLFLKITTTLKNLNDSQNVLPCSLSKHYLHSEPLWVHFESCGQRGICFFHNIEHPPSTPFTMEIMHLFTILREK